MSRSPCSTAGTDNGDGASEKYHYNEVRFTRNIRVTRAVGYMAQRHQRDGAVGAAYVQEEEKAAASTARREECRGAEDRVFES